jgi:bifunctional pyridoxal-dependent enzyme with beta-cystathionase and maltose regulon repressor activities
MTRFLAMHAMSDSVMSCSGKSKAFTAKGAKNAKGIKVKSTQRQGIVRSRKHLEPGTHLLFWNALLL